MLLVELTGVKKFKDQVAIDLVNTLKEKYGIKLAGMGKYGLVFDHPSWDYVIKVFVKDDCYLRFLHYCASRSTSNKHLPKIIKKPVQLKTFFKHDDDPALDKFWAVRIEKLEPISDDQGEIIDVIISDHFRGQYEAAVNNGKDINKFLKSYKNRVGAKWNLQPYAELIELIEDLRGGAESEDQALGGGCFADIWDTNFMQRDDHTLVLIDPYADYEDGEIFSQLSVAISRLISPQKAKSAIKSNDRRTVDSVVDELSSSLK